ncbi:hypothetical protein ACIQOW_04280 [Kitasatospora sp. NPDC091335]|uniref:hypothetical protein n=1 Tax=Kitasatospora sp. NPDC091335 TaxID=3364085 RepID=UPI003811ED37
MKTEKTDHDKESGDLGEPRSRRRRPRAGILAAVLATAVGGSLLLTVNLTNTFGPDSVCEGAVSADALNDALGWGRVSAKTYGDGKLDTPGASCVATVSNGIFGNERIVVIELPKAGDLTRFKVDAESQLFTAAANGGAAGAVHKSSYAFALFPESCDKGQRATVKSASSDAPKLAGLATSVANRVAAQQGCGGTPLPAPGRLVPAGTDRPLNRGAVCGLPGLTMPDTPGGPAYQETVTTATDPLWACSIHSDADLRSSITFLIGTDTRLVQPWTLDSKPAFGRAQWVGQHEVTATCQGKPTRFRFEADGFRDLVDKTTWERFLTAGGEAIGCEPIL